MPTFVPSVGAVESTPVDVGGLRFESLLGNRTRGSLDPQKVCPLTSKQVHGDPLVEAAGIELSTKKMKESMRAAPEVAPASCGCLERLEDGRKAIEVDRRLRQVDMDHNRFSSWR